MKNQILVKNTLIFIFAVTIAAWFVIPRLIKEPTEFSSKENKTLRTIKVYDEAMTYFYREYGRYPTISEGIEILKERNIIKRITGDAWGKNISYTIPGTRVDKKYDIRSSGPDSIENSIDDILN